MKTSYRKIFLSILFALFIFMDMFGQDNTYHPTLAAGKKWVMTIWGEIGVTVQETCDTVEVNGKFYTVLKQLSQYGGCGEVNYVREDTTERKLYYLPELDGSQEEVLFIDYTLEVGDTAFVYHNWINPVVTSVHYSQFNGVLAKIIALSCACDGWIEGYGQANSGPVPRCTEGWAEPLYVEMLDCDEILGIEEEAASEALRIFPNPVSDQLNITFGKEDKSFPLELECHSLTGQLLFKQSIISANTSINIEELPNGLLILLFKGNEKTIVKKIIHNKP
ncbi:MAG: T9SS type A sorting domain-containing protein [Saprospiraceae bacterium]|nr:T9SS type A sorting domain-containing protein [Saprospiraceae bacterium]MCB9327033.1 T9SS type A sorting domain-containing protein [Lewinellaceae bacterium]